MSQEPGTRPVRPPSYFDAIAPLVLLAVLITGAVSLFGLSAMDGALQVAIILSAMAVAMIVLKNGHSWEEVAEASRKGVSSVVSAIFILFAVGALIGTWNMAGTIPTLVYYGMQIVNPDWFYPAAFVTCAAIALGIGSSWTTAGTIGVGLVGLAAMVGVSAPITAGAVISGAYVGEKLSPLSETAILAAQLTGTKINAHLRAQVWTSVPAFAIALVSFIILSNSDGTGGATIAVVESELSALSQLFNVSAWTLLPLVLLVGLSVMKVPASLAIAASAICAAALAPFLQPEATLRFVDAPELPPVIAFIKAGWQAMATGYEANSGIAAVDSLLSRGGMSSMLLTIWLILGALVFGTLLDEFGLLLKLVSPVLSRAKTTGTLVGTVVGTAFGLNLVAGDQYVAVVLPARIFKAEFRRRGLAPTNLSRAVADGGSVTSPLIPWNSCGAYMAAVLGVPTLVYLSFALFNIASPLITLLLGFTGFKIEKIEADDGHVEADETVVIHTARP
ncbi:Na+/H+ antiporter NhaC family protein [Devosia sp. CN2-171]|uniref:Na+/H+ antiporter NhaC family protein n=1 Tax=Devosia sp. CN2-171 TaxID=3400909 RepID=UPI003BF88308